MKLSQRLLTIGLAAVPALLLASSANDTLHVHVPFSFVAAGQNFSPGDYLVQRTDTGVILIQGNGKAAAALSLPGSLAKPGAPSGLQFSSDGQREHLVGVQVQGENSRTLPMRPEDGRQTGLSSH